GEQVKGAKAGQSRTIDLTLSDSVAVEALRGQKVQATLEIKDVKKMKMPELSHEFLHVFGVHNLEQFHEKIRGLLESRLEYQQRQAAPQQVRQTIPAPQEWQMPEESPLPQARKPFGGWRMERREAGMSGAEIRARQRLLERDVLATTAQTLKEHFVLQKIAETEKIDATDDDIESEIERIADQTDQSPRRGRAQIEKDDLMDALDTQITEPKGLGVILY